MLVQLHISLAGVANKRRRVTMELPEGAVIADLVAAYAAKYALPGYPGDMRGVVALLNQAAARFSNALKDGDEVTLFKPKRGG